MILSSTFSYRDEEALVTHLVNNLEERLSGRHETRILRIVPTDHCHLGVLGPRDPIVTQPEPLDPDADTTTADNEPPSDSALVSPSPETDENEDSEDSASEAEQVSAEQSGTTRDSTRRPPSSLGFEIVIASNAGNEIELNLELSFALYTQHFPTFEEEREELGRVTLNGTTQTRSRQARQTVPLIEVFERREVEVGPITIRINPELRRQRLDDGGLVQQALDAVLEEAAASPTIARPITGNAIVPAISLTDSDTFQRFLQRVATGAPILPPLRVSLDLRSSKLSDGTLRVTCYICNNTPRDLVQRFRDQYNVLADCKLSAGIVHGDLRPVELLPVPKDYQFDRRVWAVGNSASAVVSDARRSIRTETLSRFNQPRRTTNQSPRATFSELANNPIPVLENIRVAMTAYAESWQRTIVGENSLGLSTDELNQCSADLEAFREEEKWFSAGIAALIKDDRLRYAFEGMNRVFQRTSRFQSWHLFQIVFIVGQLPSLAIREGISDGEWPIGTTHDWMSVLNSADVLWFPTGGGKTEAYLGLISCTALYDRLRGKRFGVSAWLRFPLRMLSVQQLQRAARVVWETEIERRVLVADDLSSEPISIGYFVGKSSTPNRLDHLEWSFDRLENDSHLRDKLLLVSNCPACSSTNTVQIQIDRALYRIRHVCAQCQQQLPIYVSDDEIFRFLPTVIVGTVDKIASIAFKPHFPMLWGATTWRCPENPEHGFGMADWCITGCATNPRSGGRPRQRTTVTPYDASPALHIQDELHLLQQELGAFSGHYETLVRACEERVGGRPAKIIAATATIEGFEHQLRQIYGLPNARRFPTRGHSLLESFYTSPDYVADNVQNQIKTARVYVAFRPPHLHAADAASLCVRHLQEELNRLHDNPHELIGFLPTAQSVQAVRNLLYFYSTILTYVGSKPRGVRIKQALDRDADRLSPDGSRDLNTEFLTGNSTLAEIAEVIRRVEDPPLRSEETYLDATIATSIISHGVDVERFNLMVMDGIPEETADYIQTSSRSGRRHVGLVLATLASYSIRASSIYHRFNEYHAHLERLVSPVSVNRFAKFAAQRTASGIFAGLLIGRYCTLVPNHQLAKRRVAAEFLDPNTTSQLSRQLSRQEIHEAVREAYALGDGIYPNGLELRMGQVLHNELERFLHLIAGSRKDRLTDALQPTPMTSLRDVDTGVRFRPDEDSDYRDLQWFNSEGA